MNDNGYTKLAEELISGGDDFRKRMIERAKDFNALSDLEIAEGKLYTYEDESIFKKDSAEGIERERWRVFWQNVVKLLDKQ